MNISVAVLVTVFVLIAVRKIGHFNIKIWQAMTVSAFIVVATGQISGLNALKARDLNVMLFLLACLSLVKRWLPAAIYITWLIICSGGLNRFSIWLWGFHLGHWFFLNLRVLEFPWAFLIY